MVRDLYGVTPRGTPDTRAAAADLGVSQRTVQRWVQQGMPRRSAAADNLNQQHDQWLGSPAGRRARLSPRREARLRNKGTTMVFHGRIVISSDRRNAARRSTSVLLSGDQMGSILDRALAGDDQGALTAWEDAMAYHFGGSVQLFPDHLNTDG